MNRKLKQESGDKEMNQINKLIDDENRAAEALARGLKSGRVQGSDYQAAMKVVKELGLAGKVESDVKKGGSSRKVIKGKNIPGGVLPFKRGGMRGKKNGK